MAFSDIIAYLISGCVLKRFGLSLSVIVSLSTAVAGAILYLFLYSRLSLIPIFIILCRAGNSMLLNIMYVTHNTLFPTQFQTSSFGILNFISHVAAVCAPLIAEIPDPLPFFIYAINCVLAMFASFFLRQISSEAEKGMQSP